MHSKKQYVKARTSALDLTTCAVLVTELAPVLLVLELVRGISQPTRSPFPEIRNYDRYNGFINVTLCTV